MSVAISFKDIVKKYGDTTVIPELSLDIQKGEFFTLWVLQAAGKQHCCGWWPALTVLKAGISASIIK